MTYKEFANKFKNQSDKLSYIRSIDFSLIICKKLFFDYQKFYAENHWGNPDILLDAIHTIENIDTETLSKPELQEMIQKVMETTPDSGDFGDATYAINASAAICETIEFLLNRDKNHIYNVGMCLIDTVDAKVQEDDELSEDEMDSHLLMVESRNFILQQTK